MRTIESASREPIAMLKIRTRRGLPSTRWTVAPNASHTKQLGSAARTNSPPSDAACTIGLPASALRNVLAALALTSQDFGLIHWNSAAPRKPTGVLSRLDSMRSEAAAIFQD